MNKYDQTRIVETLCHLTRNYTLADWRVIQTTSYFAQKDALKYQNEIHDFIYKKVKEYERSRLS